MRFLLIPIMALSFFGSSAVASAATTADLGITNPDIAGDTTVGSTVTYTMQASNGGPDVVPVTVADQLGDAEQLVSVSTTQGTCTDSAPVTCSLGDTAPGAVITIQVQVKFTKTGPNQHTDVVSGADDDPRPDNNAAGASFQVREPDPVAAPDVPTAETGEWSRTQTHLAVEATLSPFGSGTYYFEYGETKAYGSKTAAKPVKGNQNVTGKALITGLSMNTTYHYRVVLVVDGKTYRGQDVSGRTLGKLLYGPLTMKIVKRTPTSATYTGKLGGGLADAPGACRGTLMMHVYTLQGVDLLIKKTKMDAKTCSYKVTIPFSTKQARQHGKKGNVLVQAAFGGSYAVLNVRSTADKP